MGCEWLLAQEVNLQVVGTLAVLSSHLHAAPQPDWNDTGDYRCAEPSHP
jgi:hypothetical protein